MASLELESQLAGGLPRRLGSGFRGRMTLGKEAVLREYEDIKKARAPHKDYREARIGVLDGFLHGTIPVLFRPFVFDIDAVRRLHWNINCWSDSDVMAWKNSYVANCNSVTVAAAIFASIGLGALALPNMDSTHWIARAFFSSSMGFGILAVLFATFQQQEVGMLNDPLSVRLWLSRGKPRGRYTKVPPYDTFPLESSISALKISQVPSLLLVSAVTLFLIGFILYLLFSWLNHVEDSGVDYRNIFIVFFLSLVAFIMYYLIFWYYRKKDDWRCERDYQLNSLDESQDKVEALKEELRKLEGGPKKQTFAG